MIYFSFSHKIQYHLPRIRIMRQRIKKHRLLVMKCHPQKRKINASITYTLIRTIFGNIGCNLFVHESISKSVCIVLFLKSVYNDSYFYAGNIPFTLKIYILKIQVFIMWDRLNYTILIHYKHSLCIW